MTANAIWEVAELDNPKCDVIGCPNDPNTSMYQHHVCSNDPIAIRDETEFLRREFNKRLKRVVSLSTIISYYSCFIPWCFAQVKFAETSRKVMYFLESLYFILVESLQLWNMQLDLYRHRFTMISGG